MTEIVERSAEQPLYPGNTTLLHACKLSLQEDKPILMDYWEDSCKRSRE